MAAAPSPEAAALAARTIRALTVDAVRHASSGHVGLPLGCAEIGVSLFSEFLRHDPAEPGWPDRDRFVLSAGHGSMLLYSLLHLSGYAVSTEDLRSFRQLHSRTPGHPEHGLTPGVEATTGPLGQGITNAVGMALAERMLSARFGPELVDHRTWVLASDGDLMEGVSGEACSFAGHLGLGRLTVLYDDNGITIDGPTSLTFSEDACRRYESYGWDVQEVDGHDPAAVRGALERASLSEDRPHLIRCRTHIGFGSPAVDTHEAHGTIGDEQTDQTREALGWTLEPFEVPDAARGVFRANAARGAELRAEWEQRRRRALADPSVAELWEQMHRPVALEDVVERLPDLRGAGSMATRKASGKVIGALARGVPSLVGGSADLAGSNATGIAGSAVVERGKFEGRNIHFGVREHAMAGIASGLALHGGFRPFVGTFMVFSDYMRPAIRLAAIMRQPVIYVFTHDSIYVGEDGPTHQPVEHYASLRAVPNLQLWRPADGRETVAAWRAALERTQGPVAFALSRQDLPILEAEGVERDALRGGYVLSSESGAGDPELVLVGTGSELHAALEAANTLASEGLRVRVVSLPCLERFLDQDPDYRRQVLPPASPRLVVEAGVELGLAQLLRPGDRFQGMSGFGASAPWSELAGEFELGGDAVLRTARAMLG